MFASGGHPIMTANGTKNPILWGGSGGLLWAMDPATMQVIWTTNLATQRRDILPTTAHFAVPVIADGKLFIGGLKTLVVYGLLPVLSGGNGNNQTGTVTTALPNPITVQAIDTLSGKGLAGVTITFSDVKTGGGSFSPASAVTDSTGTVSTSYTLSTKAAVYTVTASSIGYAPATFTETATGSTPVKMIRAAGSGQVVPLSTLVPNPLVAKVEDQYGNGVAGVSVTFADKGKGGLFSANPVTTDSNGWASVSYTSSTKSGPTTVTAAVPGLTTLNIFVTVTPNPASSVIVSSGSGQKAAPSTLLPRPLVAKVTDNLGNAIPGASVTFSDWGAGGTFSANPVTTITAGTASVKYTTPVKTGTVKVTATVTGVAATASFTVTVN
jgi:hypothetical protein